MNTHDHILKSFDSELDRLYDEIKQMGDLAISQLNAAVDVLGRRDSNAAARVVANDDAIAKISPLFGSITTIAPRLAFFASVFSQISCTFTSSVVMTLYPGTGWRAIRSEAFFPSWPKVICRRPG